MESMYVLTFIYRSKEGFGTPKRYLGTKVKKLQLQDGRIFCSNNCVELQNSTIDNVNILLGLYKTELKNDGNGIDLTNTVTGPSWTLLRNWVKKRPKNFSK